MTFNYFSNAIWLLLLSVLVITQCTDSSQQEGLMVQQGQYGPGAMTGTSGSESDIQGNEYPVAPDFTLETMNGEPFTLSEHEGQVIVLNIWATWCPPCREEIPDFIEMQDELEDDGVLFVGVSVDETGWDVVRPFAEEFGINYPLVVDDGTLSSQYGPIRGIPMSFIINKKGQVEHIAPGMVTKQMLQPILEELAAR